MNKFAKQIARAMELDEKEFGGHSFRIGGATDLADAGGTAEQLRARGRWCGLELGWIYARDTVGQQIATADAICKSNHTVSLEEIVTGFTQPAR